MPYASSAPLAIMRYVHESVLRRSIPFEARSAAPRFDFWEELAVRFRGVFANLWDEQLVVGRDEQCSISVVSSLGYGVREAPFGERVFRVQFEIIGRSLDSFRLFHLLYDAREYCLRLEPLSHAAQLETWRSLYAPESADRGAPPRCVKHPWCLESIDVARDCWESSTPARAHPPAEQPEEGESSISVGASSKA